MDNYNNGVPSSTSIKPYSVANPSFKDNGENRSNDENELVREKHTKFKSPIKKQLQAKNFMNSTKSSEIKAVVHRKKILGEKNETVDTVDQDRLQKSSCFDHGFGSRSVRAHVVGSDDDFEKDFCDEPCSQPYDPVKNFLSPRPKFLMYNPNRRRGIVNLQENDEDCVKISTYFDAGIRTSGSELGVGSSDSADSSCTKDPAEETEDVNNEGADENDEECEGEDDDEEVMVEVEEDKCMSLKGILKFLLVVIALILTTQAICSMNSPTPSQTLESASGINDWYGLKNMSEVGYRPISEPNVFVGRLNEKDVDDDYETLDMIETKEEWVEMHIGETDVIGGEILQEQEIEASEVIESDNVEAEKVHESNGDGPIEEDDSDADEKNSQLTNDDEIEIANEMEDQLEKQIDDIETTDVLIKAFTFDPIVALLIGISTLILTSFSIVYRLKCKKSFVSVITPIKKEEIMDLQPSTNSPSLIRHEEEEAFVPSASLLVPRLHDDVSEQISNIYAPSVELLGEFVFGEQVATSIISAENDTSNSLIQTTTVSFGQTKSSRVELSTGDSYTAKKQRRKNAEVVTPSPVRRSSRLKNLSVASP